MSAGVILVHTLEQLLPYLNKDGILEIVVRNANGQFEKFIKIKPEVIGQKLSDVVKSLNKFNIGSEIANAGLNGANLAISTKTLQTVQKLMKFNVAGLALQGINLCATCAGFAIMYAKLDKMSSKIGELLCEFQTAQSIQADFEFMKVVSEHRNMLDSRKRQCYYTEEQMRKLVDDEYNVLDMLIKILCNDVSNSDTLITSVFSLAEMLSVSLKYFDELYYFNNKETIGDGDPWHSGHSVWLSVYDRLLDDSIIEKIQDYGFLELNLTTPETDCYYKQLYSQISEAKQSIIDNQELIKAFDDKDLLNSYHEILNNEIKEALENAITESGIEITEEDKNNAFRQIGIMK